MTLKPNWRPDDPGDDIAEATQWLDEINEQAGQRRYARPAQRGTTEKTMSKRIWILGASKPEMAVIEALLRECGERVAYAADPDRVLWGDLGTVGAPVPRVMPGEEYRANQAIAPVRGPHGECTILATATDGVWVGDGCEVIYLVECGVDAPGYTTPEWEDDDVRVRIVRIDHHRPGDPGYGRPPSEFFAASSIGQVVAELARLGRLPEDWEVSAIQHGDGYWFDGAAWWMIAGDAEGYDGTIGAAWRVPNEIVLTAAADHCLAAAYRGECPGVDPDELMRWRASTRALTTLDMPTRLHTVLKDRSILGAARVLRNLGRLDRPTFLGEMQNENLLQPTLDFLQRTPWNELRDALDQLLDQESGSPRPVRGECPGVEP